MFEDPDIDRGSTTCWQILVSRARLLELASGVFQKLEKSRKDAEQEVLARRGDYVRRRVAQLSRSRWYRLPKFDYEKIKEKAIAESKWMFPIELTRSEYNNAKLFKEICELSIASEIPITRYELKLLTDNNT